MDAGADRQAEGLGRVADGCCGTNGALGPVELGEHAVAGGLDESSSMAIDRHRGLAIVLAHEVTPWPSAKLRRAAGRIDDVGEEDRCQDPFVLGVSPLPVGPHRLEVDRNPWLVPDHPGVVSRWDLKDVAGTD